MKQLILLILLFYTDIFAKEITPYRYVTASEAVSDFIKVDDLLIIGTEEGVIDFYDLKKDKLVDQIKLPKAINILGDEIRPLIYSVSYLEGKLLFIVRKLGGLRELYIYENKTMTKLIDKSKHLTIQKVKFIDTNTALLATMGNELILFDIKNKKFIYKKQLNLASFSDFVLTKDKKYMFTADETPIMYKIELKSGNIIEKYFKANKRDIFSIDYKNGLLLSGGKDRRVILYKSPKDYKFTKGKFFVYAVALNPKATKAAFVDDEENNIVIINTNNLNKVYTLTGHKQTLIKIDFHKENELITADEDDKILFWKLE